MLQFDMRFLIFVLLVFSSTVQAKEYNLILPDSFTCKPDQCNSCEFKLVGFGSFKKPMPHMGCTELGCVSSPEIDALYKKCSNDWRYSKNISYSQLSHAENKCINGVRNYNYWEDTYKRKDYGKNHAFHQCLESKLRPLEERYPKRVSDLCQEGWTDFILSDEEVERKHAEQSAAYAYSQCKGYFDNNLGEYGFSENEYNVLAQYIGSRRFPAVKGVGLSQWTKTTTVRGKELRDVDILKNIFEVLKKDKRINHHMVITPQMFDEFMEQYNHLEE
jgi:hypothetical protein